MKKFHNFFLEIPNYILLLIFSFLLFSACQNETNKTDQEEWLQLFNGANIGDWTPKFAGSELGVNYKNTLRLEDSLMQIRYTEWDTFRNEFGHVFYKDKFSHYRLRATYRFVGEQVINGPGWAFRNNGLMLHCQSPESMGLEQDFPISMEMQLLGGNGTDERANANLCTPGTNVVMGDSLFTPHCVSSTSKTYHGDQWVTVEVLVLGDSLIQHIVEQEVVLSYSKPSQDTRNVSGQTVEMEQGKAITEGYISIQAETAPIDFKNIELLDLCGCMDKKAKNYKSYYVKGDNKKCVY